MSQRPDNRQNLRRYWRRRYITFNERDTALGPSAPDVTHDLEVHMKREEWTEAGNGRVRDLRSTDDGYTIELDKSPILFFELEDQFGSAWAKQIVSDMERDAKDIGR